MADFVEWFDGTGGMDGLQPDEEDLLAELESASPTARLERDAVLFLIDCSESMFQPVVDGKAESSSSSSSPFWRAIQCAIAFYQEKVITSDKDFVGLVLFNTRKMLNRFEFQSVYVFHEFDFPGAARVQELQVLGKAGSGDPAVYKEFLQHIGHTSRDKPGLLSEALWSAQHLFHHLKSRTIGYRRVFLFTDNDDPCQGIPLERERCIARMKDLHDAEIALEVFAHGIDAVSTTAVSSTAGTATHLGSSGTSPSSGLASSSTPPSGIPSSSGPPRSGPSLASFDRSKAATIASSAGAEMSSAVGRALPNAAPHHMATPFSVPKGHFVRAKFWDALIQAPTSASGAWRASSSTPPVLDLTPSDEDYCGALHVSVGLESFDSMVSDVKLRTHPQRRSGSFELRFVTPQEEGLKAAPVSASIRAIVNVYIPVLKCPKPKYIWLDGATNTAVSTETRLLSKATGAPAAPEELRYSTTVGGEEVLFSKTESAAMKETCSSSRGSSGLTILGFKKTEDAIRFKYNIARTAFIHCTSQSGGGHSALKFFVQLHRTLSLQNKVAIAELVSRISVAPRLVALVPSPLLRMDATGGSSASPSNDAVTGMGFHVVHLPYADDIRSFHPAPQPVTARPSDDQITKAKRIIRKLQVEYDVMSIANPALQRQYQILQQLALIDPVDTHVDDLTLPDAQGMKKLAAVFQDFNAAVFPPAYLPDLICPLPKPQKKPPTATELSSINFDELEKKNALDSLTLPYLQQYLRVLKEDTQGAKLKHEYVARVGEVVRKRRGVKREREDE